VPQASFFTAKAPAVRVSSGAPSAFKVSCPYCQTGSATVVYQKGGAAVLTINGFRDPRQCDRCGRFFRLKPRLVIDGVPLEG
jgi:hypothetical protein